ncbi:hypothetical protein HELRODRAFT_189228 [Helobdella robusta]|uniref:Uncharacterized protein n=1 Tax=Helobdella robusta TaxID=6412 RepID=T1FQU0_HELRO|nr:hypothetical protein HELRODRAFT_189228 [Helobdella robusta]ESN96405.1 hypothetical protein HELRODRAFT_189228 [Helobdella robusta]
MALEERSLLEIMASMNDSTKKKLGHQLGELVLDCTFEGYNCLEDGNFDYFFNNALGNCYTFNAGRKWLPKMSLNTGRRHGLQMVLNINQPEYVSNTYEVSGIRLVVHQHKTIPFPEDEGLAINAGQVTSLGLKQINLKRKSPPYNYCYDTDNSDPMDNVYGELFDGVIYSTGGCMRTCYQRNVISECGCGDPAYPLKGLAISANNSLTAYPPCSEIDANQWQCLQYVTEMYNNNSINCDCNEPCKETTYTVTLSIGAWPANVQKDMLFEKFQDMVNYSVADTYQENLAKVELYYEEFNHERIEEKPSYELPQFLSDCGGILGLWLGMSVLTICEFLEFGMDLFFFGIWEGCKRKRKKTKVEDIRIEQDAPNAASLNMVNLKKNPMETSKKRASFVDSPFYIN